MKSFCFVKKEKKTVLNCFIPMFLFSRHKLLAIVYFTDSFLAFEDCLFFFDANWREVNKT